jgi:uncharacterized protein YozE (UPF0346 family)
MSTKIIEPTRYYVHGDASEDKPYQYLCASCDSFESVNHFEEAHHIATRAARYESSLKSWRSILKNYPGKYRRPSDAENWIADDAAADIRKTKAAHSSFYVWLLKQVGRDDPIGDLASDTRRDSSFPVSTTSDEPIRHHLRRKNASNEALIALDEALEEFRKKPKGRAGISLALRFQIFKRDDYRCQLCGCNAQDGKRLEVDHKLAVASGGTNSKENLWALCFECNRGKQTHEI